MSARIVLQPAKNRGLWLIWGLCGLSTTPRLRFFHFLHFLQVSIISIHDGEVLEPARKKIRVVLMKRNLKQNLNLEVIAGAMLHLFQHQVETSDPNSHIRYEAAAISAVTGVVSSLSEKGVIKADTTFCPFAGAVSEVPLSIPFKTDALALGFFAPLS